MTPEVFVATLRWLVVDGATEDAVHLLEAPPGRRPDATTVRRSEWFTSLDHHDREMVAEVARSAAFLATFGFRCVLDGARAFDVDGGSLRLMYVGPDGGEVRLNDPRGIELHAELGADDPPP